MEVKFESSKDILLGNFTVCLIYPRRRKFTFFSFFFFSMSLYLVHFFTKNRDLFAPSPKRTKFLIPEHVWLPIYLTIRLPKWLDCRVKKKSTLAAFNDFSPHVNDFLFFNNIRRLQSIFLFLGEVRKKRREKCAIIYKIYEGKDRRV